MKIKGFTLIEVMIVALLAGIVGMGVVSVIANSNTILADSAVKSFKNGNAQRIFAQLSSDVRAGARIYTEGASVATPGLKLVITNSDDQSMFEWFSFKGDLYRNVYDVSTGTASSTKIIVISSAGRTIKPVITYYAEITGKYYNVDINLTLEEWNQAGTLFLGDTNYSNKYYCRINPLM